MEPAERYEILDTIASGDFATVYRARDRELRREVAVKQIHEQFLGDPQQLDRYWREAQLLASLQHPNIVTIYDIVRPRGWLILELMRGSLAPSAQGEPLDLNYLRVVLLCTLNALRFLHTNGIIHGDVKPSNMLMDPQNRVKLGDFGLARRASSKEGSLLKGTTKYMAPELVSDQFGPVGPASDLYSLGFSAYELMCGRQFESLFPGLGTFGRDPQIAWLMWHSAADRNLPEITQVLEGVPEDLAHVIQKLVIKDQSQRFQSAQDVIQYLRNRPARSVPTKPKDTEADQAAALAAKQKRTRRILAVCALLFSMILSVVMLLPERPKPVVQPEFEPSRGVVRDVYLGEQTFALTLSDDGSSLEVEVRPHDEIFINDQMQLLRDLQPGDRVAVEIYHDSTGREIRRIVASRPEITSGHVQTIEADEGRMIVQLESEEEPLVVEVPRDVEIAFNGRPETDGKPVTLADLKIDDRVVVHHLAEKTGRVATEMAVLRDVSVEGIVRDVDDTVGEMTIAWGEGEDSGLFVLPFAPKCNITLNNRSELNGQLLKPKHLAADDKVTVVHDTHIKRVDAYRVLGQAGVIQQVHYSANSMEVLAEGQSRPVTFLVGPECNITLGDESVALTDLRAGDRVDVTHDSPDGKTPQTLSVAARRSSDSTRWAVLVGIRDYDDASLSPLEYPVADAKLLRETLIRRYRVPAEQALLLTDVSLVRLRQGVVDLLGRVKPNDSVIVYFAGHAYQDDDGTVYLAPKDFDLSRTSTSGFKLQDLVDRFENAAAKEKLLLLDCTNSGAGADLRKQPSTAEMLETLEAPRGRSPLRTVTAIASCSAGQRGYGRAERQQGVFGFCLADGFSGRADANRDTRLDPSELFAFLKRAMKAVGDELDQAQTPQLKLPDNRPPRLSDEAKVAIRRLASHLGQDRIDAAALAGEYTAAVTLAGKELEPKLVYGLLLVKARELSEALRHFEEIRIENPGLLLPPRAAAWVQFDKRAYDSGVEELVTLVSKIPRPQESSDPLSEDLADVFQWAGQLREFAALAAEENRRPPQRVLDKLDAAIAAADVEAKRRYELGRGQSLAILQEYDQQLQAADSDAERASLKIERRKLSNYARFPYDKTLQEVLAGLDE